MREGDVGPQPRQQPYLQVAREELLKDLEPEVQGRPDAAAPELANDGPVTNVLDV